MKRLMLLTVLVGVFAATSRVIHVQSNERAHFHHVHQNSTDPDKTLQWYEQFFGAQRVKYRSRGDGLFTSRGFILVDKVAQPPKDLEKTAIRHIGWAGVDGPNEFAWVKALGAAVHTPLTPLNQNWFFYLYGPDREIAEVYTGDKNHLFNHVHLSTDDVVAAATWFERHLGIPFPAAAKAPRPADPNVRWGGAARLDGVSFVMIYKDHYYAESEKRLPVGRVLETTKGSPIDHIAFSYPNIQPVFDRMRAGGVTIVEPIAARPAHDLRSFFIQGPDQVLVEIVEAKPIPDGLWQ
jgi:catechol 2,3-dioxygenase-like lactoylglutathione lyase family enzyme